MGVVYRCPGVDEYGHGLTAQTVHLDGCCARFALMSDERRAATGLRYPDHGHWSQRQPVAVPPARRYHTVAELQAIVADLQRRATENPDTELEPTEVWVEYGPEYTPEEIHALYDLGRPYGLVLGSRRTGNEPPKGTQ